MTRPRTSAPRPLPRRDPAVAAVVRAWRLLTSGRTPSGRLGRGERTLVACSGGADSSALVLALAAAKADIVVAHVVHDLRPARQAHADRDAVRRLADSLSLPFVESRVSVRDCTIEHAPGPPASGRNAEALARNLRYAALVRLAVADNARFIATAHHAGDQLESLLMALLRGAGPHGLRGIAATRSLGAHAPRLRLIRPMLALTRADAERLCSDAAWAWCDDATNADTTRLRAALRARVVPALRSLRPGIEEHAATTAALLRDAADLIAARARRLLPPPTASSAKFSLDRARLKRQRRIVVGEVLRLAARRLLQGRGLDRLGHSALQPVIDAIRDDARHPRRFALHALSVSVTARTVEMVASQPRRASAVQRSARPTR